VSLSPERQALLASVVSIQELTINGCIQLMTGLVKSADPEVVSICETALELLRHNVEVINAMIDAADHPIKH
jgi:hypothetical protein